MHFALELDCNNIRDNRNKMSSENYLQMNQRVLSSFLALFRGSHDYPSRAPDTPRGPPMVHGPQVEKPRVILH
jgi:hypothetical protein